MLALLALALPALAWPIAGADGRPTGREVPAAQFFSPGDLPAGTVVTDPAALGRVAASALDRLQAAPLDRPGMGPGLFSELGVDRERVERTLAFVVRVAQEDAGQPVQRLQDPAFLAEHFEALTWWSDVDGAAERDIALSPEQIRLTRYLVFQAEGRESPQGPYRHALYAPPVGVEPTAFTRQEVMAGVYEAGGIAEGAAEPLVYLTVQGLYDALMQGTIEVRLPSGARRLFNVSVHNGHPYRPTVRDPSAQTRYWYFQESRVVSGWASTSLEPWVSVAGDVYNLGLGKLVALQTSSAAGTPELRLAVLADTGGAFQPNLFQLDYFVGSHASRAAFRAATGHFPDRVPARVLLLRE